MTSNSKQMDSSFLPPKKSLGQNFLTQPSLIKKIISALMPKETDFFVEIGPGLGALTYSLLASTKKLVAIEIDQRFLPELQSRSLPIGDLKLYHEDVLKFDFNVLAQPPQTLRVVGNLPYCISTPLLFHLIKQIDEIKDMHFMVQKEVADRITANPCTKNYGRLSVMVQYYCATKKLFDVSANAFFPKPKVGSSVISLIPWHSIPFAAKDFDIFKQLVKEAFNHRRKMISYALKIMAPNIMMPWHLLTISPQARPETLSVEDFVNISNLLYTLLPENTGF